MQIARYWAQVKQSFTWGDGRQGEAGCWGWSSDSQQGAEADSHAVTKRFVERLVAGQGDWDRASQYGYPDRPPREEILQEFSDESGEVAAILTRNAYGALVLNTRSLAFVDVDLPPEKKQSGGNAISGFAGLLGSLFGAKIDLPKPVETSHEENVLQQVRNWSSRTPDVSLRIYRTAAGFRCLVTDRNVAPCSEFAERLLEGLGSDPLYRRLCEVQQCFRARLTPKPWRINQGTPPNRFPWADARSEQVYRDWQRDYEECSKPFATCRLVEELGPGQVLQDLAPLIKLHDQLSGCQSDAPLA